MHDNGTILSLSDYFPFGLAIEERTFRSREYRYGFNGKENDTDLSSSQLIQDYGFRVYNPVIGKFLSVDLLTKSYPWYTPYQFAGNMPIWAIDLDGLEEKKMTGTQAALLKSQISLYDLYYNSTIGKIHIGTAKMVKSTIHYGFNAGYFINDFKEGQYFNAGFGFAAGPEGNLGVYTVTGSDTQFGNEEATFLTAMIGANLEFGISEGRTVSVLGGDAVVTSIEGAKLGKVGISTVTPKGDSEMSTIVGQLGIGYGVLAGETEASTKLLTFTNEDVVNAGVAIKFAQGRVNEIENSGGSAIVNYFSNKQQKNGSLSFSIYAKVSYTTKQGESGSYQYDVIKFNKTGKGTYKTNMAENNEKRFNE